MSEEADPLSAQPREAAAPPRENLIRGLFPADVNVRDAGENSRPSLVGHFAVFNEWTEINSAYEGNFMERIAPGAFKKTFQENRRSMRVLFQHGRDPQIGDKVLGSIESLEEDDRGASYVVAMHDTSYNRDLEPGLRAGDYGASFRFSVMKEQWVEKPEPSDHNPRGLPERTLIEMRVPEFGPVTWGAYEGATSGMRSLTDDFLTGRYAAGVATADRLDEGTTASSGTNASNITLTFNGSGLADAVATASTNLRERADVAEVVTTTAEAEPEHSDEPSRATPEPERRDNANVTDTQEESMFDSIDEMRSRQDAIKAELGTIASENRGHLLDAATQNRWDTLNGEFDELTARCNAEIERENRMLEIAGGERPAGREKTDTPIRTKTDGGTYVTRRAGRDQLPENVFAMESYHQMANSQDQLLRLYTDGARSAIETFHYPHESADEAKINAHLERLIKADKLDKEIAQRMLVHGSPLYRAAFWKTMMKKPLNADEQRALEAGSNLEMRALATSDTGGVTVPVQIDPTLMLTSNGALNPFRQISRNVTTTSYIWQGVTTAGVTVTYRAEGTHMTDGAPTLVAKPIQPERYDCFVPFSWEAGADWTSLEADLGMAIQDAKDITEATKFAVGAGHGSNEPQGVLVGAGTVVGSAAATAFSVTDLYALEAALPPRYQANAKWLATTAMFQKVRQFDTQGGANLWVQLQGGNPAELIGYQAYKASTVGTAGSALTSTARWGILGDFSKYVIVDRVGMTVRLIPDLFGGTAAVHYPTGQSGLVAYGRNSAGVVDSNAFRVGTIT